MAEHCVGSRVPVQLMRAGLIIGGFAAIVVVGLAWLEVGMAPSGSERMQFLLLIGTMVGAAGLASRLVPALARRSRSLRSTVLVLSLTAALLVAGGVAVAAGQMFLSSHDLTLVLIVVGVGILAGAGFAAAVSEPWTEDLERMAETASLVASGELGARTGVRRRDEIGSLAVALDVMSDKLSQAEADRRRADEARRRFFAAAGHDLRTPLASLRAAIEALQDGVAADPDRFLGSMDRDVAALGALVDDLFLLAQIESGSLTLPPGDVDLAEVADEAIEVLRPVAHRQGVSLRLVEAGRCRVRGTEQALGRVVRNLLDNAIRHAPAGTEVSVGVTSGGAVEVTDRGPGFDPSFVERAFDGFERSDPARARSTGGAGLGLAIAHGFITSLGGEMWAVAGPGGRVGFRLPLVGDDQTV